MNHSRREFLKKSVLGTLALGAASVPESIKAAAREGNRHSEIAKRVVLISLDGISVEGFRKAHTPHLDTLLSEGACSLKARVVMPSVTLPNWTSHLTGSGPEQHGVTDNEWEVTKFKLPAVETDSDGYYPSVFNVLKAHVPGMKTAFYYNWSPLINPYNPKYLDEASFLENDAYVPNYEKAVRFLSIHRNNPALVFLYSVHTDHAGHKYKWMSPEYIRSIEEADVEIGKFLDQLKELGLYRDTHFLFLSDHGGIEYGHGGVSTHEMIVPWGISGPSVRKQFEITEPCNTVNTGAVILHLFGVEKPAVWTGEVPLSIFTRA